MQLLLIDLLKSLARDNSAMGLFQQRPEEQNEWAAIPGEPLDKDPSDFLPPAPPSDLLGLGGSSVTISLDDTDA
ncbi:hypothetical protein GCM10010922_18980 [Microbacterium sorbitolivorans]|nr:hypothetical protein GCM10010922_18980 [Microbacterium sorbitolivorans]